VLYDDCSLLYDTEPGKPAEEIKITFIIHARVRERMYYTPGDYKTGAGRIIMESMLNN